MTVTCMGCEAREERKRHVTHHHEGCPVLLGATWVCSCYGPYCDEYCDGRWVGPDGQIIEAVSRPPCCDDCNRA